VSTSQGSVRVSVLRLTEVALQSISKTATKARTASHLPVCTRCNMDCVMLAKQSKRTLRIAIHNKHEQARFICTWAFNCLGSPRGCSVCQVCAERRR
jgi:hypothetical protein